MKICMQLTLSMLFVSLHVYAADTDQKGMQNKNKLAALMHTCGSYINSDGNNKKGHTRLVTSVAFDNKGTSVISASDDGTIRTWNTRTGKTTQILAGHKDIVTSAAFNNAGNCIASASHDRTIRIWDVATSLTKCVLKGHREWIHSAVFNDTDTQLVSASSDMTVRIWDVLHQKSIGTLEGHRGSVSSAIFNKEGTLVVSSGVFDNIVYIWDIRSGKSVRTLISPEKHVGQSVLNNAQTRVVSVSDPMYVWDISSNKVMHTLQSIYETKSVAFDHDDTLVSADRNGVVNIWNLGNNEKKELLTQECMPECINVMALDKAGTMMALASNHAVSIWQMPSGDN